MDTAKIKSDFLQKLQSFAQTLKTYVSTPDNQWTIKGFIDVFENIYTLSADTKVISKILEIHLFSKFLEFATKNSFDLVLAEKQNWYPDISFVSKNNPEIKFAVDLKTTYRLANNPAFCNGFTLGSHGGYFINQSSTKNIQYPYNQYLGHYCLGIIYSRKSLTYSGEAIAYSTNDLKNIPSVISDLEVFAQEKWEIASDKSGSGNTANIGSITYIPDILKGNGVFAKLGEEWFNEYWQNYGNIVFKGKKITDLKTYLQFKGKSDEWINKNIVPRKTLATIKDDE